MASSKLPLEYIVSRRGRWAVAGSRTGTAKRKIKTITALIDQLCSWGDEKGKGILKKALDIHPGSDSICRCSQVSSLPPGPGSRNPTMQPHAAALLKVILCGRHQAVLPYQELLSKTARRKQLRATDRGLLLAKNHSGLPAAWEEWGRRCQEQGQHRAGYWSSKHLPASSHLAPADAAWAPSGINPCFSLAYFLIQLLAPCHLEAGPGSNFALSLAPLCRNCRGGAEAWAVAREEMGRQIRRE